MADADARVWPGSRAAFAGPALLNGAVWPRWLLAAAILLACLALRAVLDARLPGLPPYITLFPAVAITGLIAGTRIGVVVALLGGLTVDLMWITPRGHLGPLRPADAVGLALYAAASACVLAATHLSSAARARAQAYFDVAEVMLVVVGADRRIKAINRHGAATLGVRHPAELIGRDWFELCVPAEQRAARLRAWTEALARLSLAPHESEILRADGARRLIRWRQTLLRDAGGAPSAVLSSGDDVTAERATEEALRRSEARLNAVLRQVPAAVSIIEPPDGRLTLRSDRSFDVLGHPPHLNSGGSMDWGPYGALHPDGTPFAPRDYPIMRALLAGETVEAEHFKYRRPDGTLIDLEVYAAPIRDPDGSLFAAFGIAFDITQRAEAERRLRVMLDERELLLREADHRIKNSLQLVASVLGLQRRHAGSEETAQALAGAIARVNAVAEAHLALQLSDDLQTVDFADMLTAICRRLNALSDTVRVACACTGKLMLEMDRAIPLALIVSELITNALRHAYDGAQPGEVQVAAAAHGPDIVLTVRDTGRGFDSDTRRPGLGTRVTGSLASKIACTLHTRSRPGEGTQITARLPATAHVLPPPARGEGRGGGPE